ncbi:unnamed protein product [Polarella glacialis]|uniref:Enoyl reductase (ER) domain-containing protein n=1 Tax=Polarella glacialis TaxID=89957 RepID=A0A813EZL2_POLGL|nr:unnamed protein product [Polarella glacialis]
MATIVGGKGTFMLAALDESYKLTKVEIGRPAPGPNDVAIDIKYCGMCHSDLHTINGDWGAGKYPIAPGHEAAGVVREVGAEAFAAGFKVGDNVAVGCMVMSCLSCQLCTTGLEQHCPKMCQTYANMFPAGCDHDDCSGTHTNGGYSTDITVHKRFVFKVPEGMKLEHAGPLCCAGITTYAPLARHVKGKVDQNVGVVGFGGLGHMAVKIAIAMGAKVTIFSRNDAKKADAAALGADLVVTSDTAAIGGLFRHFDCILDTVSCHHEINSIISTLKAYTGILVLIGGVPQPYELAGFPMVFNGTRVEGSLIGGAELTQEMLEFCAAHEVLPETEIINAKDAEASLHLLNDGVGGVKRFVIDAATIRDM